MLTSVFATKLGMTQAWTESGKRLPVTKCKLDVHQVVALRDEHITDRTTLTPELISVKQVVLGYGQRPLPRLSKPLRGMLAKQGLSTGVKTLHAVRLNDEVDVTTVEPGMTIKLSDELAVGDVVQVQGTTKGRGFAGVVKRHGFHGGPATHGQSDRQRAPGAIGQRTTPGRVFRNQRMAGHYGVATKTVTGLVVLHLDAVTGEVWLSGPVPGSINSTLKITKMGRTKAVSLHGKKQEPVLAAPASEAGKAGTEPTPEATITETTAAEVVATAEK